MTNLKHLFGKWLFARAIMKGLRKTTLPQQQKSTQKTPLSYFETALLARIPANKWIALKDIPYNTSEKSKTILAMGCLVSRGYLEMMPADPHFLYFKSR